MPRLLVPRVDLGVEGGQVELVHHRPDGARGMGLRQERREVDRAPRELRALGFPEAGPALGIGLAPRGRGWRARRRQGKQRRGLWRGRIQGLGLRVVVHTN